MTTIQCPECGGQGGWGRVYYGDEDSDWSVECERCSATGEIALCRCGRRAEPDGACDTCEVEVARAVLTEHRSAGRMACPILRALEAA